MIETIQHIRETDWGLEVALKPGGVIDDSNILPTIEYMLNNSQRIGKRKVIVDATTTVRTASVFKMLEVADLIQRLLPGLRIAFIAPALKDNENSRFMETAGHNRGAAIRYFDQREKAMEWLEIGS